MGMEIMERRAGMDEEDGAEERADTATRAREEESEMSEEMSEVEDISSEEEEGGTSELHEAIQAQEEQGEESSEDESSIDGQSVDAPHDAGDDGQRRRQSSEDDSCSSRQGKRHKAELVGVDQQEKERSGHVRRRKRQRDKEEHGRASGQSTPEQRVPTQQRSDDDEGDGAQSQRPPHAKNFTAPTEPCVNTGRGHTKRKQAERYGFEVRPAGSGQRKQQKATKKRPRTEKNADGEAKRQRAGAQKWIIKIGTRMIERIEGRYEAQDAPT